MQGDRAVPCLSVAVERDRDPVVTRAVVRALAEQCGAAVEPVGYLELTAARLRARPAPTAPPVVSELADARRRARSAAPGAPSPTAVASGPTVVCVGTGRQSGDVLADARALVAARGAPVLAIGARCRPPSDRYERLVVALDGSADAGPVAAAAAATAHRLDLDVVFTVVITSVPGTAPAGIADADESGYLRNLRHDVGEPTAGFDALHDARPADGIVRYVGRGGRVIVALGLPTTARHGVRRAGRVALAVLRRAACPVLLVPAGGAQPPP